MRATGSADREAIDAWRGSAAGERRRRFEARAAGEAASAADLYLLGCARLRGGDVSGAARAFGAAYHRNCALESAALLTFACLKAGRRGGDAARPEEHVLATWEEMGRPALGSRGLEAALLAALGWRGAECGGAERVGLVMEAVLGLAESGGRRKIAP